MDKIAIQQCELKDLERLQNIAYQSFRESFGPGDDPVQFQTYLDKAFHPSQMKKELENLQSFFYFLKKGNELAGYLKLNIGQAQTEPMSDEYLEIERIYLLKKFYGQGLGRIMINKAIEIAKSKSKNKIWLGVWEKNLKAIAFYKHLGFKITGSHPYFIGNLEETDWVMELKVNI